jgi:hypothetical protein
MLLDWQARGRMGLWAQRGGFAVCAGSFWECCQWLAGHGYFRHKVIASLGASQCLCLWDYETKACSLTLPLAERFHSGASAVGAGLGVVELSDRFLLYGKVVK